MPMVQLLAPFRMHTNIQDLAMDRVGARFGVAGLADPEDPRESGKVLPMTRGSYGFFYQEGSGERRQLAEDAHFRGKWSVDRTGVYRPGIPRRPALTGLGLPVYYTDGGYGAYYPGTPPTLQRIGPIVAPLAPNQSVPPTDTSTPLPTGTGTSGGNVILTQAPGPVLPTTDNTWFYLALAAGAAFLLFSGGSN